MMAVNIREHFEQEKNKKAAGYTAISVAAILFLLFVINWKIPYPPPPLLDEGIEVNLGNSETGLGDIPPMVPGDPAPEPQQQIASTPPSNPPAPQPVTSEEDNNDPDAVELPRKQEKTVTKPKAVTPPAVAQQKVSQQPPAPPQPKPKATMGAYTGAEGTGGNNQDAYNGVKNQGVAGGTGDQGKPNGNINSDNYTGNGGTGKSGVAISRGLTGRSITRFPSFEDDFNENAKIAVDIRVNESGQVVSAAYQSRGSTSSNTALKNIALRKAKELKFNSGEGESIGTVVFNFRLKG
jgi:outer membrane biosynthesis protein TonB